MNSKYSNIFKELFDLNDSNVTEAEFHKTNQWDSVGHMSLIAELEAEFNIYLEAEDLLKITSYQNGKEVLKKYGVEF